MLDSIAPLHKVKIIFHSETSMAIVQLYEAMITGEDHKRTIIDIEMNNNEELLPQDLLS